MRGDDIGKLKILRMEPYGASSILWSRQGNVEREWNHLSLNLDPGLFQIIIIGHVGPGPYGDIAIDDIAVNTCVSFGMLLSHSFFNTKREKHVENYRITVHGCRI